MMFLAPNGRAIDVGPSNTTRYLDTAGAGAWSFLASRKFGWRDYGSAVMYADGKIVVAGGSDPPTATTEVIDLNAAAPAWRLVGSMSVARRHLNATALPDGTVLATGGTSGAGFNNADAPVFAAELWDPATGNWTPLASASIKRIYHSSALLLPDGRVLTGGGDGQREVEVFSPPYLFKGARPAMSGVPPSIGYGQTFPVQSPDAAGIQKVTLIRLGSVTHAFDQNQRLNVLQFTRGTGTVDIVAPANGNLAPPGDYMLFIVNGDGVPSMGSIVRVGGTGTSPPPPPPPPPPPGQRFTLTVTKAGTNTNMGEITSSPSGINCGTTCSASLPAGNVTLTVTTRGNACLRAGAEHAAAPRAPAPWRWTPTRQRRRRSTDVRNQETQEGLHRPRAQGLNLIGLSVALSARRGQIGPNRECCYFAEVRARRLRADRARFEAHTRFAAARVFLPRGFPFWILMTEE